VSFATCLLCLAPVLFGAIVLGPLAPAASAAAPWATNAAASARHAPQRLARLSLFAERGAFAAAVAGSGAIEGTVTAKASGAPVAGIEVCALEFEGEQFGGCAETAADGTYEIEGLAVGEYAVEFFVPEGLDYLNQFWDGKARALEAQPVSVSEGGVSAGIDAQLIAGAGIDGFVTGPTAAGLAGIEVCAEPLTGGVEGRCTATSGAQGAYSLAGLSPGRYEVSFSAAADMNYATEFYDGSKDGTPARTHAEPVELIAEATRGETNARMHAGGIVEGTVTAAKDSSPISGIEVCAVQAANEVARCAKSGPGGSYEIEGLADGATTVSFEVPFTATLDYADQFYDGKARPQEADALAVEEGVTLTGIDAALEEGGRIEGLVTSAADGHALAAIEVCASPVDPEGAGIRCVLTNGEGRYQLDALAEESYDVEFSDSEGEYATQFYKEAGAPGEAEAVAVQLASTVGSIDAALLFQAPRARSQPTISGRAVEGETLTATHASWTGKPTSYLDEWGLCPTGEVSEACTTIGKGETLTLSAADVGGTIALREKAANAAGFSTSYAYSRTTAIVVQRAPQGGGSSQPEPGGQVGQQGLDGGGVLGSTSRLPSVAQLKALLGKLLRVPSGRAARIGSLVGHGGYTLSFRALSAGSLMISWYAQPHGAAHAVLVAHVHLGLAGAGRVKVRVVLTARGRRMLRRAPRGEVRVLAKGVLTASGQTPVSVSRNVTLTR
jgi:hypothetical protein